MLKVLDIAYQGGGMVIAFNDNSTVVAIYEVIDGQLTLSGLTDEQETALKLFNDAANVDRLVADPRTNLIFGDDFQFEEDDTISSITGTAGFQVKLTLGTPVLTGTYMLQWTSQIHVEGPNMSGDGRVEAACQDGIIDLGFHQTLNIVPAAGGPLKNIFSGHKVIAFNKESKMFDIVWRTKDIGDTAYICRARLTLWRLR